MALRHARIPWLLLSLLAGVPASASRSWEWSTPAGLAPVRSARAASWDAAGRRLAVGDEQGVWLLGRSGVGARRVLHRGPVSDLLFEPTGALLVATPRGLFAIASDGRVDDRSPGPGESARSVRRLAVGGGWRVCASAAGVYIARPPSAWRRVRGLPRQAASALALSAGVGSSSGGQWRLYAVVAGALFRADLTAGSAPVPRRVTLPEAAGPALDVIAPAGAPVTVLHAGSLSRRSARGWRSAHPSRPPGAQLQRLAWIDGTLFVASDRGLLSLVGERLERTASPAGRADVAVVVGDGRRLYAAGAEHT